jgi:hypothetical protein
MRNRKWYQAHGATFTWGQSAYRVCVQLNGRHLATYDSRRAYAIPAEAKRDLDQEITANERGDE